MVTGKRACSSWMVADWLGRKPEKWYLLLRSWAKTCPKRNMEFGATQAKENCRLDQEIQKTVDWEGKTF